MFLHRINVDIPANLSAIWSKKFIEWLSELADSLEGGFSWKLHTLISTYNHQNMQLKELYKEIIAVINREYSEISSLLITIPGVGRLLASKLLLELMDLSRFADARHLAGYIGLVRTARYLTKRKRYLVSVSGKTQSCARL